MGLNRVVLARKNAAEKWRAEGPYGVVHAVSEMCERLADSAVESLQKGEHRQALDLARIAAQAEDLFASDKKSPIWKPFLVTVLMFIKDEEERSAPSSIQSLPEQGKTSTP